MSTMMKAVWTYRGFVLGSVKREFQLKSRNSLLGTAWSVLNPLAMIVVYTVIFSQMMKAKLPGVDSTFAYSIYLCAGLLTWGFLAEIVGRAQNIFIDHANLMKKLSFPRMTLPVIVVLSAGLNFAIIFGLFLAFLVVTGNFPGWALLGRCSGPRNSGCLLHRAGCHAGRAQRLLPRCGPVFRDLHAVLVLAYADRLPGVDLAGGGARHPAWLQPHGTIIAAYQGIFVSGAMAGLAEPADAPGRSCGLVRVRPAPVPQACRRDGGRALTGTVRVEGLGKAFKQYPTRWSRLAEWMLPFTRPAASALIGCCVTLASASSRARPSASSASTARARARCSR